MTRNILLLFSLVFLFSCVSEEEDEQAPDFTVLGITSVTINDKQFKVQEDGALLDREGDKLIIIRGTSYTKSLKQSQVDYSVALESYRESTVSVESKYSDTNISVNRAVGDKNIVTYTVDVKRSGYKEHLIYTFLFWVMPS